MASLTPYNSFKTLIGTVLNTQRAGSRTLRVRVDEMVWNKRVRKFYPEPYQVLVLDPNCSCLPGDVIQFRSNFKVSDKIRHVVTELVRPHGIPADQRPIIPDMITLLKAKEVRQQVADICLIAADGDELAFTRVINNPGAQNICKSLLEMTALVRSQIQRIWKDGMQLVPNPVGDRLDSIPFVTTTAEELQWKGRDLLQAMKLSVKQLLELTSAETPAERRRSVNLKLVTQWENLTALWEWRHWITTTVSALGKLDENPSQTEFAFSCLRRVEAMLNQKGICVRSTSTTINKEIDAAYVTTMKSTSRHLNAMV